MRFNIHRTGFKNPLKNGYCKIPIYHFTNEICKGERDRRTK